MWVDFVIKKIFGFRGEQLRDYFDHLELEKVIPQLLHYVFEKGRCENIVWITAEEYERIHQSSDGANSLKGEALVDRHLKVQSLNSIDDENLFNIISKFSKKLTTPAQAEHNNLTHVLVPIQSMVRHEPIAYLLLINVVHKHAERVMINISRDISQMEKHIGFSMQYWQSQRLSLCDDLTGLYNQKYMSAVLDGEIARALREHSKFTVLFLDIDYFKAVNDTRGHWVGSKLLVEIARLLNNSIRRCDYAFRYGGDEFVIVMPQTQAEDAVVIAERLRETIEKANFIIDGEKLHLTLSIGLACFPDHARSYKDIIKIADEAMYSGKVKSRNTVFVAS